QVSAGQAAGGDCEGDCAGGVVGGFVGSVTPHLLNGCIRPKEDVPRMPAYAFIGHPTGRHQSSHALQLEIEARRHGGVQPEAGKELEAENANQAASALLAIELAQYIMPG